MEISRIKLNDGVQISYSRTGDSGKAVVEMSGKDAPVKGFREAYESLASSLCNVLHLPDEYVTGQDLNGISIKRGNELMFILKAKKTIDGSNRPFNIISPLLTEGEFPGIAAKVEKLMVYAEKYINGESIQLLMFPTAA